MPGPSKLNENLNIERRDPLLTDDFYFANPSTGYGGVSVLANLIALLAGTAPTNQYVDIAEMLANTTIQTNYFAYVVDATDDPAVGSAVYALYLYTGGDRSNLANYSLIASGAAAFTLANGNGTTVNGNAVDLGGDIPNDTILKLALGKFIDFNDELDNTILQIFSGNSNGNSAVIRAGNKDNDETIDFIADGTGADVRMYILDLRPVPVGIEYNSDYSLTFTDRSLVDKGTVNQLIAAAASHFRGLYSSEANLTSAIPVGLIGDYAYVDAGVGADVQFYVWDNDDTVWKLGGAAPIPDASTTVKGKIELATDAETITGTDTVRAVVPSSLAAWWTDVKAKVQTWAQVQTWTLGGVFTVGPTVSDATASLMAAFNASKKLVSIAYALFSDVNTGTDNAAPVTSLALEGSKYNTRFHLKTYAASTSSANTYTGTLTPAITTYGTASALVVYLRVTNGNTGASTVNLNSVGAVPIVRLDGSALQSGDIPSNSTAVLLWDGSTNFILQNQVSKSGLVRRTAVVSSGTMTLDCEHKEQIKFETTAAISSGFTIALTNAENLEFLHLTLQITGSVPITFASTVISRRSDSRWNNSTKIGTLVAIGTGDFFDLSLNRTQSTAKYILRFGDANYPS